LPLRGYRAGRDDDRPCSSERFAWRHTFLILQILFVRDANTAFTDGRRALGLTRLSAGIIIAFLTAVFAFVSKNDNPLLANTIFSVVPVFGIFVYDVVMYAFSATVIFFSDVGVGEMALPQTSRDFFCHWHQALTFLVRHRRPWFSPCVPVMAISVPLEIISRYWTGASSMPFASRTQKHSALVLSTSQGGWASVVRRYGRHCG
jgi:hypothetical protein